MMASVLDLCPRLLCLWTQWTHRLTRAHRVAYLECSQTGRQLLAVLVMVTLLQTKALWMPPSICPAFDLVACP